MAELFRAMSADMDGHAHGMSTVAFAGRYQDAYRIFYLLRRTRMTRNSLILALAILAAAPAFAQKTVPNPLAPAASTGAAAPTAHAAPAAPAAPAATPAKSGKADATPTAQAPGGGAGKVWVNTASKVYHCEGGKYYGKTKKGEYLTESDARAKGFHGVGGKSCAAGS